MGKDKEGTVSAFSIDRADGHLTLLNTVGSGGGGPTYVSIHPSGRFLLVANYFGGSVAVLPILPDGRLGNATDVKNDAGKIGPTKATNAPPGSFAFSGHDRTHAHMIQADPAGAACFMQTWPWIRSSSGSSTSGQACWPRNEPPAVSLSGERAAAFPFSSQRPLALLHSGRRLDNRSVRLRCPCGAIDRTPNGLDPAARVCRQQFLFRDTGFVRWAICLCGQPAARQHRDLFRRPKRRPRVHGGEWTEGIIRAASASTPPAGSSIVAISAATTSPSSG